MIGVQMLVADTYVLHAQAHLTADDVVSILAHVQNVTSLKTAVKIPSKAGKVMSVMLAKADIPVTAKSITVDDFGEITVVDV